MPRFSRTVSILLFALALVVRLSGLMLRGEYHPPPEPAVVGAEAGAIAHHLLAGHGFATPFDTTADASPSTHLPPLYPYFLAGLGGMGLSRFWIFAMAIALNLLASASLPVLALYIGAAARFPKPVTLLAALALCFCPEALRAVGLVWDEALLTTLAALLLLYMIRQLAPAPADPTPPDPAVPNPALAEPPPTITATLGFLNGLLALLNPALCIAIPFAWLAALQARGVSLKKLPAHAFLLLATTFLGSSPWHIRNWFLLDPPAHVFIRGNFWLEVWSSLHPVAQIKYADGTTHSLPVHPWQGSESLNRTDTVPPPPPLRSPNNNTSPGAKNVYSPSGASTPAACASISPRTSTPTGWASLRPSVGRATLSSSSSLRASPPSPVSSASTLLANASLPTYLPFSAPY